MKLEFYGCNKGADIFVGVSAPNIVSKEMVQTMNKDLIFLLWLIQFQKYVMKLQKKLDAKVVGTGRSDFPTK